LVSKVAHSGGEADGKKYSAPTGEGPPKMGAQATTAHGGSVAAAAPPRQIDESGNRKPRQVG
jgi:hypothetical protein